MAGSTIVQTWRTAIGGLPRTYWVLWFGTLLNRLGTFVMPFLTLYLTQQRGLTAAQAGNVVASYGIGAMLANPFGGALADRIGRRPTMMMSLVLGGAALLALSRAQTLEQLVIATFAFGFFADAYRPASAAMIADVIKPEDRLRAFSHLYWAINLGAGVAPLIGGLIANEHFNVLFLADAATTFAYAALIYFAIPETRPATIEAKQLTLSKLSGPLSDRAFVPFVLVSFLCAFVFFQFMVALPIDMKANGLSNREYSAAIAVNGFLIVFLQPLATGLISRYRRSHVLACSCLLVGTGFGASAFAGSSVMFWVMTIVVWTVGEILMAPVNSSVVADLSPADQRGRYQGAFNMSWNFAFILGPAVGGEVITHYGSKALWAGCFAIGVIAAGLHFVIAPARRRRMLELHPMARTE